MGRIKSSCLVAGLVVLVGAGSASADGPLVIEPRAWRIVTRESGKVNYYSLGTEDGVAFVRSRYRPPMDTAVLGWETPEADRSRARRVRWTWRALTLPVGGDECVSGRADSAAVVYVSWRRGLRYYAIKYVWSATSPKGAVCDRKRSPFVAQDTVVLESGGPLRQWRSVAIDLALEFRNHFEGGDANADVPAFVGLGLMSDGDQTHSESSADFGTFIVER